MYDRNQVSSRITTVSIGNSGERQQQWYPLLIPFCISPLPLLYLCSTFGSSKPKLCHPRDRVLAYSGSCCSVLLVHPILPSVRFAVSQLRLSVVVIATGDCTYRTCRVRTLLGTSQVSASSRTHMPVVWSPSTASRCCRSRRSG